MSIVVVTQAISTAAHTGVLRSCGDLYINHPAVVAARLAAFVSVLRQSSLAGCTTRSTKAPGLRSGSSAPPGCPKHHPAVVIGVPGWSCTSAWCLAPPSIRSARYVGLADSDEDSADEPGTPLNTVAGYEISASTLSPARGAGSRRAVTPDRRRTTQKEMRLCT